jgi:DNA-binding transcriptional MerR regulator
MDSACRYTIAELADASAAALDALGIAARNGQVRDRPDARTIRYYGTLGLIDAPAEITGRTARYGGRHLLQILAVKAVQARGDSLADAQRTLVGASDEELRSVIGPGLPAALAAGSPPALTVAPEGGDARHPFWRTPPALPAAAVAAAEPHAGDAGARPFVAVPLDAGATLLIEGAVVGAIDIAALRAAAGPLLAYLTETGLLPGPRNH